MIKNFSFLFALLCFFHLQAFASRGIAVAANDKYAPDLYASLQVLRNIRGCQLPIEVWHAGDELCDKTKAKLQEVGNISFHDLVDYYGGEPKDYWGYHIKGYMLYASFFDELILMDADVFFFENPEKLFYHPAMLDHCAYIFRDREDFLFHDYDRKEVVYGDRYFTSQFTYKQRRDVFLSLIPETYPSIPQDWRHYWENDPRKLKFPIPSEHQDSGCIVIDKRKCVKACELIMLLNRYHDVIFRYILGDKETYWMALAATKTPFYVNDTHPYKIKVKHEKREMIHQVRGELFFMQKSPIYIPNLVTLFQGTGHLSKTRRLTSKERAQLNELYVHYKIYYEDFQNS